MNRRTQNAIQRAGQLDRAQVTLEESKRLAGNAYAALIESEPETAAIVAQILMRYDEALRRLAQS